MTKGAIVYVARVVECLAQNGRNEELQMKLSMRLSQFWKTIWHRGFVTLGRQALPEMSGMRQLVGFA